MLNKIKTFKDGNNYYAAIRIKDMDGNLTGIRQIIKQGKTKEEAIKLLKETVND